MTTQWSLVSTIEREEKICDLAQQELKNRCRIFENKYNLSSDEFYKLFQEGKMGDEEDFFEWKALIEGIKEWACTKENLKGLIK
ncbi:MAG: hypothetical protein CV087_07755 [Candidatus Brocadia sp. WS118]|nr:MAG: hypothetical protein CV087_07755 [Candidatus Brocadia sp. WS118]